MDIEVFNKIIDYAENEMRRSMEQSRLSSGICTELIFAANKAKRELFPDTCMHGISESLLKDLFNKEMYPRYGNGRYKYGYWAGPKGRTKTFGHEYAHCRRLFILRRFKQLVNANPEMVEDL